LDGGGLRVEAPASDLKPQTSRFPETNDASRVSKTRDGKSRVPGPGSRLGNLRSGG
jgi:hypothetical protein